MGPRQLSDAEDSTECTESTEIDIEEKSARFGTYPRDLRVLRGDLLILCIRSRDDRTDEHDEVIRSIAIAKRTTQ
jgi:hypothetical protein